LPTLEPTAVPTAQPTPGDTPSASRTPRPQRSAPATPEPQTYVVQPGDTLSIIADQFGTSVEALQAANGIDDPDEIVPGQVLIIPS
jgi:LysM repeat protein